MKTTLTLLTALLLAPLTAVQAADFKFTPEHEAAVNRQRRIFFQYDPAADIQRKCGFGSDMDSIMRYVFDFADLPGSQIDAICIDVPTNELTSSNAPLRGGKGEILEGGIRVPFIVSWRGRIKPRVIDAPVISMDATATALELGRANTESANFDGRSLLPLLMGGTDAGPHDTLFWRVGKKNAVRHGSWKLVRDGGAWRLYDLAHDIGEARDLAPREAKRVAELSSLWTEWDAQQIEPLWK